MSFLLTDISFSEIGVTNLVFIQVNGKSECIKRGQIDLTGKLGIGFEIKVKKVFHFFAYRIQLFIAFPISQRLYASRYVISTKVLRVLGGMKTENNLLFIPFCIWIDGDFTINGLMAKGIYLNLSVYFAKLPFHFAIFPQFPVRSDKFKLYYPWEAFAHLKTAKPAISLYYQKCYLCPI